MKPAPTFQPALIDRRAAPAAAIRTLGLGHISIDGQRLFQGGWGGFRRLGEF